MILGIGFESVDIGHIAKMYEHDPQAITRVLSSLEMEEVNDGTERRIASSLAARYALKHAAAQSIEILLGAVSFDLITTRKNSSGRIEISLDTRAQSSITTDEIFLLGSLSHSGNTAVAVVVAQTRSERT